MMHRKQVSTESMRVTLMIAPLCLGSDNFDKWGMSPLAPAPASIFTPIQITEWPWVSSPLSPDVSSHGLTISPAHTTSSDIRLWSGQFSLVSPLLCSVELTVITPTKNSVFTIFPASDIAACWGDWHHDDPMELGWIVNNASNLFLSKEINP